MFRILNILTGLLFVSALMAQDIPFTHSVDQYLNNGLIINPAYVGSREALSATIMHRSQWLGFQGAPISQILTAHTPLKNEKVGLGIMFDNYTVPTVQYNSFYFNYAYRMWIKSSRLALGIKGGGYIYHETLKGLDLKDPVNTDPAFTEQSGFAPNFGAGAYLYNNKYVIGLAVPFFMSLSDTSRFSFDPGSYHYILTAGYLFDISPNFKIKPAVLVDYNKYFISYQFATHLILFKDAIWLGGAYKSNQDLTFMMEVQINPALKVGYAYDHSLSNISHFSGSHEIMIRYELRFRANIDSPLYF